MDNFFERYHCMHSIDTKHTYNKQRKLDVKLRLAIKEK